MSGTPRTSPQGVQVKLLGGPGHEETVTVPLPPPPEIIWSDPVSEMVHPSPLTYKLDQIIASPHQHRYHLVHGRHGRIWYEYPGQPQDR